MKHYFCGQPLFVAVLAMFMVFLAGCDSAPAHGNKTMPTAALVSGEVAAVDADGLTGLLDASKGQVTVVNFWATWCPPCVAEMPELAKFYRNYAKKDLAFHAVSLDPVDAIDTVIKPFLQENGISFPIHVLADRDIEAVSKAVKAEISGALPVTLIYDRSGNLIEMWEGGITLEDLDRLVKPLL